MAHSLLHLTPSLLNTSIVQVIDSIRPSIRPPLSPAAHFLPLPRKRSPPARNHPEFSIVAIARKIHQFKTVQPPLGHLQPHRKTAMQVVQLNKSSIGFLLADSRREEAFTIVPKTGPKVGRKMRRILRPNTPKLSLEIIQQPTHAKVTSRPSSKVFPPFAEHRPIHPPPVLQLKLDDVTLPYEDDNKLNEDLLSTLINPKDPKSVERVDDLKVITRLRKFKVPSWTHYSTFFVIARLQATHGHHEGVLIKNKDEKSFDDDLLIGTKVSSGMAISLRAASPLNSHLARALPAEKPHSTDYAITFVLSDLSVKKIGKFKLKFDLFEVNRGKIIWRNEVYSDQFEVFTPKKFPGSKPSTLLTSFLYNQGAKIRQRRRINHKLENLTDESTSTENTKSPSLQIRDSQPLKMQKIMTHSSSTPLVSLYKQHPNPAPPHHYLESSNGITYYSGTPLNPQDSIDPPRQIMVERVQFQSPYPPQISQHIQHQPYVQQHPYSYPQPPSHSQYSPYPPPPLRPQPGIHFPQPPNVSPMSFEHDHVPSVQYPMHTFVSYPPSNNQTPSNQQFYHLPHLRDDRSQPRKESRK